MTSTKDKTPSTQYSLVIVVAVCLFSQSTRCITVCFLLCI